jgi:hypothetical protein
MSGCRILCLWCGRPFAARRGGSPQRFCKARCRTAFWSALRRWAERAVATGVLTIAAIRNGATGACTLPPGAVSPADIPGPQGVGAKRTGLDLQTQAGDPEMARTTVGIDRSDRY